MGLVVSSANMSNHFYSRSQSALGFVTSECFSGGRGRQLFALLLLLVLLLERLYERGVGGEGARVSLLNHVNCFHPPVRCERKQRVLMFTCLFGAPSGEQASQSGSQPARQPASQPASELEVAKGIDKVPASKWGLA